MGAIFDHLARMEHDDAINLRTECQAMRDDDRRATPAQLQQLVDEFMFGRRVNGGGWFVKNQQIGCRRSERYSRERKTLPLSP